MQSLKLIVLIVAMCSQVRAQGRPANQAVVYVWDLLKPPILDVSQVVEILSNAQPGTTYPIFASPPETGFRCPDNAPGYYADVKAQCQVFYWCGLNGEVEPFMCVNSTLFNQLTLTCDYFFNVDCQAYSQHASFANSRLFSDQPLFDSPPADYLTPGQRAQIEENERIAQTGVAGASAAKPSVVQVAVVQGGKGPQQPASGQRGQSGRPAVQRPAAGAGAASAVAGSKGGAGRTGRVMVPNDQEQQAEQDAGMTTSPASEEASPADMTSPGMEMEESTTAAMEETEATSPMTSEEDTEATSPMTTEEDTEATSPMTTEEVTEAPMETTTEPESDDVTSETTPAQA